MEFKIQYFSGKWKDTISPAKTETEIYSSMEEAETVLDICLSMVQSKCKYRIVEIKKTNIILDKYGPELIAELGRNNMHKNKNNYTKTKGQFEKINCKHYIIVTCEEFNIKMKFNVESMNRMQREKARINYVRLIRNLEVMENV